MKPDIKYQAVRYIIETWKKQNIYQDYGLILEFNIWSNKGNRQALNSLTNAYLKLYQFAKKEDKDISPAYIKAYKILTGI